VLDVEQPGYRRQLIEVRALAGKHQINLALSNPCFECWLLGHFERTARAFTSSDQVIERLNQSWRKATGQEYQKNEARIYERVSAYTATAISTARFVREVHFKDVEDLDGRA